MMIGMREVDDTPEAWMATEQAASDGTLYWYVFQLRVWSTNEDIHAPDCLLARA